MKFLVLLFVVIALVQAIFGMPVSEGEEQTAAQDRHGKKGGFHHGFGHGHGFHGFGGKKGGFGKKGKGMPPPPPPPAYPQQQQQQSIIVNRPIYAQAPAYQTPYNRY